MVASFIIPPGADPKEIARKREIADRLFMQGMQSQPKTIGDGLGSIADMLLSRGYHEAAKRDSGKMNEIGQQAVNAWMGGGGMQEQPATPQESYIPDGVSVAQMAPPPGAQGGNVPGVMPDVAPYNPQPQQPNQTGIQVDQVAARRAFRNLTDDELLSNLMNPQLVQATEWLNPAIPQIAREELARRWNSLDEKQKQEFQLYMQKDQQGFQAGQQERGFQHDFNKMYAQEGLPSQQADTEYKRVQTAQGIKDLNSPGKAQVALDTEFAKDMAAWEMGGAADAVRQLSQLEGSMQQLQSGRNITGPIVGRVPDLLNAFINPETMQVRDEIADVTQRNLRAILGGQFAQKEGEQLIQRAFDPTLGEEVNRARLARLMEALRQGIGAKQDAMQYFRENGTLQGWQGKIPTMQDFYDAVDQANPQGQLPQGVTEEDVEFTMRKHGLTREQVLERLR